MEWVVVVLGVWLLAAVITALLVGHSIRRADQEARLHQGAPLPPPGPEPVDDADPAPGHGDAGPPHAYRRSRRASRQRRRLRPPHGPR